MPHSSDLAHEVPQGDVAHEVSEGKVRLVIGALGFAGFAYYTRQAYLMPIGEAEMPGPGLFPLIVGVMGLALSVVVMVDALAKMRTESVIRVPGRQQAFSIVGVVLLLGGYVLVIDVLGAYLSSLLFTALSIRVISHTRWWKCLAYGTATALPVIFLFDEMLNVSLPGFALL